MFLSFFVLYLFVRHLLAVSLSRLSRLNSETMLISLGRKVVQNFVSEALDGAITECLFVSIIREYDFRVEHAHAVVQQPTRFQLTLRVVRSVCNRKSVTKITINGTIYIYFLKVQSAFW